MFLASLNSNLNSLVEAENRISKQSTENLSQRHNLAKYDLFGNGSDRSILILNPK